MLHSKGKCFDLVIAISEDATASASNMNIAIAGDPGAIFTIQIRKLSFQYMGVAIFTNLLLSSKISFLYEHTYYTNWT